MTRGKAMQGLLQQVSCKQGQVKKALFQIGINIEHNMQDLQWEDGTFNTGVNQHVFLMYIQTFNFFFFLHLMYLLIFLFNL